MWLLSDPRDAHWSPTDPVLWSAACRSPPSATRLAANIRKGGDALGRLTGTWGALLLKAVLVAIPIYYMSIFRMPAGLRRRLEKTMQSFFWRGSQPEESRKAALIAWSTVCRLVSQGGLSIHHLQHTNVPFLTKWVRHMMQPLGDLVSMVLRDG